jgi:Fe-S cluster assembly protein SufD
MNVSSQTIDKADFKSKLLTHFDTFRRGAAQDNSPRALSALQQDAFKQFESLDLPTTKHEEWKYTNLRNLLQNDFRFPTESQSFAPNAADVAPHLMDHGDANVLVFVNGFYRRDLSTLRSPVEELHVENLGQAHAKYTEVIDKYFARIATYQQDAFTALNTAVSENGAFIYVPSNKVIEKPVYLYFITDATEANVVSQPRNLFVVGRNSQATFVESFRTIGSNIGFTNVVTEVVVQENAVAEYYKIQNETAQAYHIGTTQALQSRDSKFSSTTVSLSGSLIRNNLNIVIDAENCESNLYGLYVLNGKSHVDNHTLVDHAKPRSYSNELYKGILDEKSTGVFNGKIMVRPDAQKTNAFQSNRNIVLSAEASMNTKPQLEIFADDVKCSHGATTGQLDEEMLFYLRARGIGREAAKALLMQAFAGDVLNHIRLEPVKNYVEAVIANRFGVQA